MEDAKIRDILLSAKDRTTAMIYAETDISLSVGRCFGEKLNGALSWFSGVLSGEVVCISDVALLELVSTDILSVSNVHQIDFAGIVANSEIQKIAFS